MMAAATAEEWKPLDIGTYEVSNRGRVRNINTGALLATRKQKNGYVATKLHVDKVCKTFYVHRLVAAAFCYKPEGCNVVNHLDHDKTNNRPENLEWTTQRENNYYTFNMGYNPNYPNPKPVIGTKNNISVKYRSANEAAEKTGCNTQGISDCCLGRRKQHHGIIWKFAEVAT